MRTVRSELHDEHVRAWAGVGHAPASRANVRLKCSWCSGERCTGSRPGDDDIPVRINSDRLGESAPITPEAVKIEYRWAGSTRRCTGEALAGMRIAVSCPALSLC